MDNEEAAIRIDFLQFLETDVSVHIMSFLDDPADVVRASAVSRNWRKFVNYGRIVILNYMFRLRAATVSFSFCLLEALVGYSDSRCWQSSTPQNRKVAHYVITLHYISRIVISNGLAKHFCIRAFPQLSEIVKITEVNQGKMNLLTSEARSSPGLDFLERQHKIYASLHRTITKAKVPPRDCIETAVSASSTDRMPDESILNTLNPRDRFIRTASYWSSKGQSDPSVPETLVYKLKSGIWVITEVDIQPFEAFFQLGSPVYSAKSVRFRLGNLKPLSDIGGSQLGDLPLEKPADDMFEWTYTSPELMSCNNLSYQNPSFASRDIYRLSYSAGVCYVRALGRSLSPAFNMDVLEPYGFKKLVLRYDPEYLVHLLECSSSDDLIRLGQVEDDSRLFDQLGLLQNLLLGFRGGENCKFGLHGVWGVNHVGYSEMEIGRDFMESFSADITFNILKLLSDPSDIIRASAVSRSWRHFVIATGLCKKLWLKKVPQVRYITCSLEENDGIIKLTNLESENTVNWRTLEIEHKFFSSLNRAFSKPVTSPKCILAFPVGASSTDRDPPVTIINTLSPEQRSFWSSKGQNDHNAPEYLLYRLTTSISIVTEVHIRPLEVFWENARPVYSARSVRFLMGHPKSVADVEIGICPLDRPSLDKYVWTYVSPWFSMKQKSCLQKFKLPEPVICIGGIFLIELLGRAQKDNADGLFYIR
ncbi:F-box family protein [Striga asiatica]|uniref:F-box family protein n=1 Tax=Striga asiatica TaxID=4170 RepID=A0A5A7RJR7_STRAF|nr:F-box family protein [Striga asiatica]